MDSAGALTMNNALLGNAVRMSPSAWLPAAEEAEAYEAIRQGDASAFRAVAEPLQPVLRRLTQVITLYSADADVIIARTWGSSLRALDMFHWRTPFATWIAGATVTHARVHARRASRAAARPAPSGAVSPAPGPPDWSDFPWGARWGDDALPTLASAFASLPQPQREVVHARDVEQWPSGRVCDVLGLVEVAYERLLIEGRTGLRNALAPLVGDVGGGPHEPAQRAAVIRVLTDPTEHGNEPLDPRTLAAFRQWRISRLTIWRRALGW